MRLLIFEDEIPAQRLMLSLVKKLRPEWVIEAVLESIAEGERWLAHHPEPDLILSDIQLADGLAFTLFERHPTRSSIIFTTAWEQYAIKAFTANGIGYLLKPIAESDLSIALDRFDASRPSRLPIHETIDLAALAKAIRSQEPAFRNRFLIELPDQLLIVPTTQIAWFLSKNRITHLTTTDNRSYALDIPLDTLETQLDPRLFFRVNRQMILAADAIERIETAFNGKLSLKTSPPCSEPVSVSRERAPVFREWIDR